MRHWNSILTLLHLRICIDSRHSFHRHMLTMEENFLKNRWTVSSLLCYWFISIWQPFDSVSGRTAFCITNKNCLKCYIFILQRIVAITVLYGISASLYQSIIIAAYESSSDTMEKQWIYILLREPSFFEQVCFPPSNYPSIELAFYNWTLTGRYQKFVQMKPSIHLPVPQKSGEN